MALEIKHNHKIYDTLRYAKYEPVEQELFEAQRNSLIEFLRDVDEVEIDQDLVRMAERASFVFVDTFPKDIKFPPPPATTTATI